MKNRGRGGDIDRASDLRFTGRGFESWLGIIAYWPWANYLHLCASVAKQYNLVPAKESGKDVNCRLTAKKPG